MPHFGKKSTAVFKTLHPDLQAVLREGIRHFDFALTEGHRSHERQAELKASGKSRAGPGESPHNSYPSDAVDILIPPYDASAWTDEEGFAYVAGRLMGIADSMGVVLRWGNDWDRDGTLVSRDPDESFNDRPHIERWK